LRAGGDKLFASVFVRTRRCFFSEGGEKSAEIEKGELIYDRGELDWK